MEEKKTMEVSAIKDGTVIDHIPASATLKLLAFLELEEDNTTTIGVNLSSPKFNRKGIIKISDKILSQEQIDKISLFAPNATISIIEDFNVKEKSKAKLPESVKKIIKCSNPNCITNHNPINTLFHVVDKDNIKVKCHYCERIFKNKEIVIQ